MSVTTYAAVSDIKAIGKSLTAAQEDAAAVLLEQASAKLRLTARKYGKDIDAMLAGAMGDDYALAVKSVIVQAVCRALDSAAASGASVAMSQGTETIGSYSLTATYLNAGQSMYFLRNELKDLGLLRQSYGALDLYGGGENVYK